MSVIVKRIRVNRPIMGQKQEQMYALKEDLKKDKDLIKMSQKNASEDESQPQIRTPRSKSIGNVPYSHEDDAKSTISSLTPQSVIYEVNENLQQLEQSQPIRTMFNNKNRIVIARSSSVPIQMIMKDLELLYPQKPKPAKMSPKSKLLLELWKRKMQLTVIHLEESMTVSALG